MAPIGDTALAAAEDVYRRWLPTMGLYPLRVVLGGYAANLLPGDPVWINTVGGSGYGKTETMHVLDRAPLVRRMSAITGEAALLSGAPKKDHAKDAVGGMLAEIGSHGVLVLKDFTTVLGARHETRTEILAALREVYDGSWTRDIGEGGGRKLAWSGKVGVITGCTGAWDRAHAVTGQLGERFLTPRIPELDRHQLGRGAIANAGHEQRMRDELAEAGAAVFDRLTPPELVPLDDDRVSTLAAWANVVTLARSPVDRDYQGELEFVPDPEAPTRFVKALAQLYQGFLATDLDGDDAWATTARIALDCVPKLRRRCIVSLIQTPGASTSSIAERTGHPSRSTRRALEELVAHGLADRDGADDQRHRWTLTSHAASAFAALSAARIITGTPPLDVGGLCVDCGQRDAALPWLTCEACLLEMLAEHATLPPEPAAPDPARWLAELLAAARSGTDGRQWQCPAHRDSTPSLGVEVGRNGAAVVHCLAGCPVGEILAALALRPVHLFTPPDCTPAEHARAKALRWRLRYPPLELARGTDPSERLVAVHPYGETYKLERWRSSSGRKRLVWFRRDAAGCWIPGLGGVATSSLPLYRDADIALAAASGDPLYVVESESSVDALNKHGHYAVTWAGGAGTPPLDRLATLLAGVADVRVVADHDEPGIRCVRAIRGAVPHGTGWLPPRAGGDVRDVLAAD